MKKLINLNHSYNYDLKALMHLPLFAYWINADSIGIGCNDRNLESVGLSGLKDFEGTGLDDYGDNTPKLLKEIRQRDIAVMKARQSLTNIDSFCNAAGAYTTIIQTKHPLIDADNEVVGVVGMGVILSQDNQSCLDSITAENGDSVHQLIVTCNQYQKVNRAITELTETEKSILLLFIKGYPANLIAKQLCFSYRTIENYLSRIRVKLGVNSKLELYQYCLRYKVIQHL